MSTKHPGDPTPRSVREVLQDHRWRLMTTSQTVVLGGGVLCTIVVLHCGTESYFQTAYESNRDDVARHWFQVEPVEITHIVYQPVKTS